MLQKRKREIETQFCSELGCSVQLKIWDVVEVTPSLPIVCLGKFHTFPVLFCWSVCLSNPLFARSLTTTPPTKKKQIEEDKNMVHPPAEEMSRQPQRLQRHL